MIDLRSNFTRGSALGVIAVGIFISALAGCVPSSQNGDPATSVTTAIPSIKMGDVCQYLVGFLQVDWIGTREGVTTYDPDSFTSARVFGMSPPQASCTYISNRENVAAEPPKREPYYISLKVIQEPEKRPPRPGWKSRSLSIDNVPIVMFWQDDSAHDWRMTAAVEFSLVEGGWSGHVNLPTLRGLDPTRGEPISEGDVHVAAERLLAIVRKVAGSS